MRRAYRVPIVINIRRLVVFALQLNTKADVA